MSSHYHSQRNTHDPEAADAIKASFDLDNHSGPAVRKVDAMAGDDRGRTFISWAQEKVAGTGLRDAARSGPTARIFSAKGLNLVHAGEDERKASGE